MTSLTVLSSSTTKGYNAEVTETISFDMFSISISILTIAIVEQKIYILWRYAKVDLD